MKYIPYKDRKAFAADLKTVYRTINEEEAYVNLQNMRDKWGCKYPNAINSWEDNWDNLITFLAFPDYIRKIMYTTNIIESLHSQFRKVTKTRLIFPNDESLLKMLYLATEKVSKKWTRGYANWDLVMSQLKILFTEVLNRGA
jgi:transposase-like protein